ncbi:uncharacterized protein CANTADRAFT_27400 [Suhomyces tanzawaensis NRRL Y-17324]|uniref:Trafficking protein particle complex II-specific subunit 65 IgD3 domain-containing protein n=1 Tax=Suhomyces tanzawaensis NRRL Y-17324 TaxID=984487 RepID=A0A1E4SBT7_9ASCO|nr:uncharacterized protein CANTADRAFT_27400 [Suhomyces tanzawaensis NRRL Y-17324]ODV76969.1 hypothetical protein CANTADRAFT_27400 [Suhomyces tanzawaensis NRRL Y-17324]
MSISIVLPRESSSSEHSPTGKALVAQLKSSSQRPIVFFDETIHGYILYQDQLEPTTKRSTAYLDVSIVPADVAEALELDSFSKDESTHEPSEDHDSPAGFHSSNFSILDLTLNESDIVYQGQTDGNYYIVWRFEIPVTYPRKKSPNPRIMLTCYLHADEDSQQIEAIPSEPTHTEVILPDYQPGKPKNLFAELNNQIASNGIDSKQFELSSSLIESDDAKSNNNSALIEYAIKNPITPIPKVANSKDTLKAHLSIPVSVSIVIKLKSTKPAGRNNILLATLNIESSDDLIKILTEAGLDFQYHFKILSLSMDFKFGDIKEFKTQDYEYPVQFRLGDAINLTYKLLNNEFLDKELKNLDNNSNNFQHSRPINIKLNLQVQSYKKATKQFEGLSNVITTNWSPYLDFSIIAPPINNSLKTSNNYSQMQSQTALPQQPPFIRGGTSTRKSAMMNSLYKSKSPNSLNAKPANSTGSLANGMVFNSMNPKKMNTSIVGQSSSSVTVNLTTTSNSTLSGLKLTFKGKLDIKLGEIINWKVQAINNSTNRLNLSLIVQNPINFNPIYSTNSASNNVSSSNLLNSDGQSGEIQSDDIIIYNKLQLYSSYNALKLATNGIIILNNDIRIGPLDSGTVFETDIKLIGISKGIFNLDGIKIFDINSGDGLDFGKLVEVFVV